MEETVSMLQEKRKTLKFYSTNNYSLRVKFAEMRYDSSSYSLLFCVLPMKIIRLQTQYLISILVANTLFIFVQDMIHSWTKSSVKNNNDLVLNILFTENTQEFLGHTQELN